MGRLNKTTEGVFVNIVGTSKERSSYDQFITRSHGLQIRALTNMKDTIKLYTVRDTYVYGRCPFFRSDNDINEVRVLIDPIDLYFPDGTADLEMLSGNQLFMMKAYDKVSAVMLTEIVENVNNYKKIYSK